MYSPSNYSQSTPDPTTKRGIIILSIFLLLLIGFFAWYNYRTSRLAALSSSNTSKENFLTALFNPSNPSENVPAAGDDSDNDGLSETEENKAGTNTSQSDSDNDGLTDREEVKVYKTNPLQADSDNDTMKDGDEIQNRRDPNNSSVNAPWPPTPPAFSPNK